MRGYTQVYTGDGKGKTTAALGLALRAHGAGFSVYIAQFVKGQEYSEVKALRENLPGITLKQYGRGCFIYEKPTQKDIDLAQEGLTELRHLIASQRYDVVILDEIHIATHFGLISVDDVLGLMRDKPESVELILTGRKADPRVIAAADLVTEMKEIKHYYQKGVAARKGIES